MHAGGSQCCGDCVHGYAGGSGGFTSCLMAVTPGDTLNILVAGGGGFGGGGFGGGG